MESNSKTVLTETMTRRERAIDYFGLERNVVAASGAVFLLGMGEELWKKFLPKYLESLGAGTLAIGLFGTTKDFLDAVYQYPGGWLADHLGRRIAFLIFIALASIGYLIYLFSPSWIFVFLGLAFAMAWSSMASPAIFAIVGDSLPKERRAMGFTVQSILKRVPMTIAPIIGGMLIAGMGVIAGVKIGLVITLVLAVITVLIIFAINIPVKIGEATNVRGVWRSFHFALKKLLVSDIIIRTCEGMAEIFIVLYVTNVIGVSLAEYGILVAIQMTTAILVYIPSAKLADRIGRKPFVIATFLCFALFPLVVVLASNFATLVLAFIVGGLREIGEPSRKAMIVDFAEPHLRARSVGLYYLVRSLSITPAAVLGGLLWKIAPQTPFVTARVIGLIGTIVFAVTVEERYAS
ncbi:MAG TPA: MFS transporter [Pyrinomonadaceae bacterium]|nr:MFS transporter [Pyrinomonadaceae bacterium]